LSRPSSLIVGANGQVGRALLRVLGERALPAGRTAHEPGWVVSDLGAMAHDREAAARTLEGLDLSAVYCVGGATDVERCETDEAWAMETNCDGPAALARASRGLPFVFFSTDYVFDGIEAPGHPAGPYSEDSPTHPLSVYGRSKLLGEQAVLAAHPSALVIRTSVVYGYDAQRKNFLYTLHRLLSAGTPMRVADDQLSSPTFNEDLAAATVALLERGHTGLFHVVGPEVMSRFDFALLAAEILGLDRSLLSPLKTHELNQRAPRPLVSGMRIDKLRAALPDLPMRSNDAAIRAWQQQEPLAQPAR
jgi:dTDP-4-dehydrorhamnose reductase